MTGKAIHGKEKYFFTENIFDEGYVEEALPPTFNEQELEAAKQKSIAEGRQLGLKEAEGSQLKVTSQILAQIQKQLVEMSAAEGLREKLFEQEVLKLSLAIFERLFPLYNQHAGFEELKETLSAIMKKQEGQSHIAVVVTPDVVSSIEAHLNKLKESGFELKFTVKGDETLPPGTCRLAWNDGGAIRNPQMLADEIRTSIEQVLAKKASKGHDRDKGTNPEGEAV